MNKQLALLMFAVGILTNTCYSAAPEIIEQEKTNNPISTHTFNPSTNPPAILKTDYEKKLYTLFAKAIHENWNEEQISHACQKFMKENGSCNAWSFRQVLLGLIIGGVSAGVIVFIATIGTLVSALHF